ncbi:amidohydrolase family protein [Pseudocitrobacter corydidari]|jgi:predicted TIM-barrel fold metal-dependent hydrolase|uniref:Amidohydrolase-related domain-containing protein n=1 Tax=Pseudocitrobacter corydidari TaxID=2891570 RepID=A0ABY3S1H3_9ENTR|nr:amidohydrolase family protein [Pseudocitrobacter corydidari]UGS39580.1 hypothetical protein G163CM_02630 [Pseudocitrobacter corydidari]
MSKIIDANMHWLPGDLFSDKNLLNAFLDCVPKQYGVHTRVEKIEGKDLSQLIIEQPKGYVNLNYAEGQYTLESQLADMEKAGVDHAIFRLPVWQEWLDLETCKKVNDRMAEYVKRSGGKMSALAVVPPWGTDACLREVDRCLNELGFRGAQIVAHYGQIYLDDPAFRPYLKYLNSLNVPVVVHHTPLPVDYHSVLPYTNQRRQFGRCIDQATAVGRELFSGMFDELPNLKFIHSMLGGAFYAFADMLVPQQHNFNDAVDRFQASTGNLRAHFSNNIFFDTSGAPQWGKAQLEAAVKVVGGKNILYGSSYPIRKDWFFQGIETIESLDISAEDKANILGGNAARMFGIE